jgi:hypothetical protein
VPQSARLATPSVAIVAIRREAIRRTMAAYIHSAAIQSRMLLARNANS